MKIIQDLSCRALHGHEMKSVYYIFPEDISQLGMIIFYLARLPYLLRTEFLQLHQRPFMGLVFDCRAKHKDGFPSLPFEIIPYKKSCNGDEQEPCNDPSQVVEDGESYFYRTFDGFNGLCGIHGDGMNGQHL